MGTIICQNCDKTLGYYEDEKVTVLYGTSHKCGCCEETRKKDNK